MKNGRKIRYLIMDPSKNITALGIDDIPVSDFNLVAKKILKENGNVEQVGFLSFNTSADIALHMAGDEFCGNATMCAAAYYLNQKQLRKRLVKVSVYGVAEPVSVNICEDDNNSFSATVDMPKPIGIRKIQDGEKDLPIVEFSNIDHIIIETNDIYQGSEKEEKRIRQLQAKLDIPSLGIIFFNKEKMSITPLVYVKKVDTVFWENSCASGTTALAAYIASINEGKEINLSILQPSGATLNAHVIEDGKIELNGNIKIIGEYETTYCKI